MSHFDFAVGMRLHFLIFAALNRVPFVALPYSSKVAGFLEDLEIAMPPLKQVNAGQLIAYIDRWWDLRRNLQARLEKTVPEIQDRARRTNEIALRLLTDGQDAPGRRGGRADRPEPCRRCSGRASRPTITLAPRTATVAAECDVLVVGGGPAGLGAAIGAADAGRARDPGGALRLPRRQRHRGAGDAAHVLPHPARPPRRRGSAATLMPHRSRAGRAGGRGRAARLLERLVAAGGAIPPSLATGYVVPFDPEMFKLVALDLLDEAGVQLPAPRLRQRRRRRAAARRRGLRDQVGADRRSWPGSSWTAPATATSRCWPARPSRSAARDGLVQPMTLMFRMVEFERAAFAAYVQAHPDQWRGVHGLWDLVREASAAGELELPREDILFFGTPHERRAVASTARG